MNAARRAAQAGRNLLIALVVGALIIVAIVVAYVVGRTTPTPSAGPAGAATVGTTATAPSSGGSDAAPTGCLGGSGRDAAMVLGAQREAAPTTFGAVEVAAGFFRWTYQAPHPTSAEIASASAVFVPAASSNSQRALLSEYERNPNPSDGVVADGDSFHLSTVGARWAVAPGSTAGRQRVSILAPFVIEDAISPTKTAAEAFEMQLVDGRWRVVQLAEADPGKLRAGGTDFTAGC